MNEEQFQYFQFGQNDVQADWDFALGEYCDLPDDVVTAPTAVALYIGKLQSMLKDEE